MVKRFSYDAWGKRRLENWQSTEEQVASEVGRIGFTGHEMLDELGLIHMNGRVYDPTIGRFLSADPFIQDNWFGTQAFNRYSYVQNNPLSYTDPSGYMAMVDHTETGTGGGGGWSDQHEKDDFDYGEILDPDIAGNQQELEYGSNSDFIEGRNKPPAPQEESWSWGSVLDSVHAVLDVAGQIPGVGIGADLLNAAVYLGRGQIVNAGISAAGAVPGVGHAATAGRIATRVTNKLAAPGEDLFVGTYNQVRRANIKSGLNPTHTPHHAVQNAVSTAPSPGRGVTINMSKTLHEKTRTYRKPVEQGLDLRTHLARDVKDLRSIFRGAGYDRSTVNNQLQELIRQNKSVMGQ